MQPTRKKTPFVHPALRSVITAGVVLTALAQPIVAQIVTSAPERIRLGFFGSFPFSDSRAESGDLPCNAILGPPLIPNGGGYSIGISGTGNIRVVMDADMVFSYDKANVLAGATMPVNVSYTPVPGDTPNIHITVPTTVSLGAHLDACVPTVIPPFSEVQIAGDSISIPLTFTAGPTDFVAPLTGDSPVTVPVGSSTLSLSVADIDVGSVHLEGTITLAPVPAGGLALGGAVAAYSVAGPGTRSPIPVLEWDTAGASAAANVTLNNPLPGAADVEVALSPIVHWLATSADVRVVINLSGTMHDFGLSDPSPISVFSGSLGEVFSAAGLDTRVSDAVTASVGFDPGFGDAIADGKIPIPLTEPPVEDLSGGATPTLGGIVFTFNTDVTPPVSSAAIAPAPTVFGWNNSSVNVTITAADTAGGSGVQKITFSATGAQPIGTTHVAGSLAVVPISAPGITTITYFATDNQNNVEAAHTITVRIDEIAPTVTIVQPAAATYPHSATLTLSYSVTDAGGSGVNTVSPTLDGSATLAGHGLASGQPIPLLTELALGMHSFTVAATDKAANASSLTVDFEIVVTADSIKEDVNIFLAAGKIKNSGLANSLLAKLNAAAAARARGNCATAANIYNAFINEINAQTGTGIDATAAAIMIADAQYLIAHCP